MKYFDKTSGKLVDITMEEVSNLAPPEFIAKRDDLLVAWQGAKQKLDEAKELEAEFRKASVEFISDPSKKSGTENIELGNGYKAKTVKKLNYGFVKTDDGKLDKKALDRALERIEKDGPVGELIAERLVKWTPDLSLSEYKLLSDKYKNIIDAVIVTTEGMPTLEIIEPKAKK